MSYIPMFASDWLGSTRIALMTPAQEGAYFRLLCHCWADPSCSLTSDPAELAVLSRLGDQWGELSPKILACFDPHPTVPGRLCNPRLSEQHEISKRLYEAHRKGGEKRWCRRERPQEAIVAPLEAEMAPETEPEPTIGYRADTEALINVWNEGLEGRSRLRVTPGRVAKVRARLEDGFTLEQLTMAIRACKASPFHNGQNDRGWKAPGPEWVLHKTERVEEFLNGHGRRPAAPRRTCQNCNGLAVIPRGVNGETRPCPSCPEGRAQMERTL
jgi:uncharacterized protein YdaU (DUF1376 family)